MDWMYAPSNVRKQMEEEGHVYSIAYKENEPCGYVSIQQQEKDVFYLQKIYVLPVFRARIAAVFIQGSNQVYQGDTPGILFDGAQRKS